MSISARRIGTAVCCAAFGVMGQLTLSACGGLGGGGAETVTVTASGSAGDSATATPTSTLSYPSVEASRFASETTEPSEPSDQGSPTGPPVIRNSGSPKSLTLADVFEHDYWKEGLYQTPQSATPVQAMGVELGCGKAVLEVRLAQAQWR